MVSLAQGARLRSVRQAEPAAAAAIPENLSGAEGGLEERSGHHHRGI